MAKALDEIKSGISIDATGESDGSTNRVNMSNITKGHHTVIPNKQQEKPLDNKPAGTPRKTISIDAMGFEDAENNEDVHESLEKDLLDVDNPESPFRQYYDEKQAEAAEWLANKAEEQAVNNELGEDEDALEENNLTVNTVDDVDDELADDDTDEDDYDEDSLEYEEVDDLDWDFPADEEDEDSEEEEVESTPISIADLKEASEKDEAEVQEEINAMKEAISATKEIANKEPEKPVRYDAPDIDVEIDDKREAFATEIIEDDESDQVEIDDNEQLKKLQKLATEKLKPVSKKLDISSFTVLKKPVTNIAPLFEAQKARVCKWVLPAQESIVKMKEFSGSELEKLREYSDNSRSADALNRRFNMIYDHIVSPKPATFEAWLKTTPYEDVDHYFFAIYIASFKGANYLPEDCPNDSCKETYLTDDIDIMSMVKFDTKEAKKKFAKLYESEVDVAGKGIYCTEVVPLSNKIAVSFRDPSIYNLIEIATLSQKSREQYSSIIEYIPYIDTIYLIDSENQQLVPVNYKAFPESQSKTILSKVRKYDNVLSTLSVDEFGPIKAYIAALSEKTVDMHYVYPSVECPKCHRHTEEQVVTAEELVFTRYQLGALVATSLS